MIGRLHSTVIDCPDPDALASFYEQLLGAQRVTDQRGWVKIRTPQGAHIAFQEAPDLQPPRWPDPDRPQQFHLDIDVDDVTEAEPKVLALGATRLDGGGGGPQSGFRVYADPVGHPFCLVWG
jgi:catechol 2,3-dioxygenase-like lactoylglutathione lyase family enzyme